MSRTPTSTRSTDVATPDSGRRRVRVILAGIAGSDRMVMTSSTARRKS